jgi:hypothetical protein
MGIGLFVVGISVLVLLGWIAYLIDRQTGVIQTIIQEIRMGM